MSTSNVDNTKKGRFSRFLEKRKEKDAQHEAQQAARPSATVQNDSGYATSEKDSGRKNSPDFVAVENHEIPGVDRDRTLWLDKNNGEIYDEDTGDVVTTVTTTTTTTTTTTSRGGRKQEVVDVKTSQSEPQTHNVEGGVNRTGSTFPAKQTGGLNEMPADNIHSGNSHATVGSTSHPGAVNEPVTSYGTNARGTSVAGHHSSVSPASAATVPSSTTMAHSTHPDHVPSNVTRDSGVSGTSGTSGTSDYSHGNSATGGPVSPTTPTRHNFSYPSRSGLTTGNTNEETGVKSSGSTLSNLKAAAVAAHGIGETLRGTINDTIDSRYPRSNTNKAAAADMKNQTALERGRNEMEGLNNFSHHGNTAAPTAAAHNSGPTAASHNFGNAPAVQNTENVNPGAGTHPSSHMSDSNYRQPTGTHTNAPMHDSNYQQPTGTHSNAPMTDSNYHPPRGTAVGMGSDTNPMTSETGPSDRQSSGFGKLFKRKPVGDGPASNQGQPAKYY